MFLQARVAVHLPVAVASERLCRAVVRDQLPQMSDDAYCTGLTVLARVGPFGTGAGLSKRVLLQLLPARPLGDGLRLPIRWVATGSAGRLFPSLDADLDVTGHAPGESLLTINACYTPPFGAVGSGVDRLVLRRAARATLGALLRSVADSLLLEPAASGDRLDRRPARARVSFFPPG